MDDIQVSSQDGHKPQTQEIDHQVTLHFNCIRPSLQVSTAGIFANAKAGRERARSCSFLPAAAQGKLVSSSSSPLAEELEVSKRSVYRDIADLIGQRVPIQGEAGLGYVLASDFDMPPLMLTPDEVEAAVLGALWVAERGDPVLARTARDLIAKLATAVPERLRPFIAEPTVGAPPAHVLGADGLDIAKTRLWIRSGRKIRIRYRNQNAQDSERTMWPVIIGYAETVRLLAAWCESRRGFGISGLIASSGPTFLTSATAVVQVTCGPDGSTSLRPSAVCVFPSRPVPAISAL